MNKEVVILKMEQTVRRMTLRDALGFAQVGEDMLEELDARLRQIPNI